ncbi:MAG TPA: imidazole glycerol phosphate synthase subunit HisH, partial [Thermomicrobiales bacterium]|nr:imidazole glycerol phosphate synthase subunit HisH [Thermomicrobiales bacterium]
MIGVIDYGAGNIRSISRGLVAAGAEVKIVEGGSELVHLDGIVLPGVGHAGQLMRSLEDRGFCSAISAAVATGTPFLGICVGLQIMFGSQEEGGGEGFGFLPGRVQHLPKSLKTPHMGWSEVESVANSPLGLKGFRDYFYFVHSYAADLIENPAVVATTTYGVTFPSVVIQD